MAGLVWAQKNQSGAETFWIVMLHVGKLVALAATGMKPELMPGAGVVCKVHGLANVDCVTEWFLALNSKLIVSPASRVTLVGLKARALLSPTVTVKFVAEASVATEERMATVEKRIFKKIKEERKT